MNTLYGCQSERKRFQIEELLKYTALGFFYGEIKLPYSNISLHLPGKSLLLANIPNQ